jgi:hypothetical protein
MGKHLHILTITLLALPFAYAGAEEFRELPASIYIDKMKAGWIGQMAGVGWGGPTEFKWNGVIIPADRVPKWQPEMVNQFEQDDIYVEMTFLRTLEEYGIDASMHQAGIDFAGSEYLLAHANIAGRGNLREGIAPPDSGHPRFNNHADDIDYQIEADYSGLISPGLPNEVIRLGDVFGRLMNYGDGLYGGQFIGGMYAEAFFEDDMVKIVEAGLKCIPEKSQYAEMVRDMLTWYTKNPEDWKRTWQWCEEKYHKDARYTHGLCCKPGGENSISIDAKLNGAYVIMGLLYGRRDPDQTIIISTRCGQDSDCNPSNAAGILFTTLGYSNIPDRFKSALDVKAKFSHTPYDFDTLVAVCERLTRQSVLKAGGKIERDASGKEVFLIPNMKTRPSKLEQSWKPGPIADSRYTPEEMDQMQLKVRLTKGKVALDDVTYDGLVPGEFMRKWLLLGPIPLRVHYGGDLDDEQQKAAFDKDFIDVANFEPKKKIFDGFYEWSIVEAGPNIIDLLAVSRDDMEAQIAYLWAQIDMPQDKAAILGIGSDDAVKVWLNGELLHENWVERGAVEDDDRVPVRFKKGKNQLVLKIQNTYVHWGFCCRMLDE